MTATATPYRPQTRTGRDGFARTLRAEWTKFRTVRGWVIATVVAAVLMVQVGLLSTAGGPSLGEEGPTLPVGPGGEAVNDGFYFVHQPLGGDGSITVPVTALTGTAAGPDGTRSAVQPWAKAGLIVKQNLEQGSAYTAVMVTGAHGVRMQHNYTQDTAGTPGTVSGASPRWLRLVRAGDTVTAYDSTDGARWNRIGSSRQAGLGSTVQVGLFVTSPSVIEETRDGASTSPAVATAAFGRVALQGSWSQGSWKGEQLGRAGTSGSYTQELQGGFSPTGTGFNVRGAGDIAPVVGGPAMGEGYTIENFLVGVFAGLIVMIVVGTMFITVEYRRGLIRTTLAANPRRGRMLAAKAVVVGTVAFAIGLAAAAITLPLGENRARGNGFHVLPVTSATELRVVAGTALLVAVTAVLALAVGALLRRSALAATIVVAAVVLPYSLATSSVLPAGPSEWLLRITPAAGFAIQQTVPRYEQVHTIYSPAYGYYPLAPWAGFAVLCGYTALALGAAVFQLRRRDA